MNWLQEIFYKYAFTNWLVDIGFYFTIFLAFIICMFFVCVFLEQYYGDF